MTEIEQLEQQRDALRLKAEIAELERRRSMRESGDHPEIPFSKWPAIKWSAAVGVGMVIGVVLAAIII